MAYLLSVSISEKNEKILEIIKWLKEQDKASVSSTVCRWIQEGYKRDGLRAKDNTKTS